MSTTGKYSIWNRRKGEVKNDDELSEDNFVNGDPIEHEELITKVQKRVGVSRGEAKRIIRNSELI